MKRKCRATEQELWLPVQELSSPSNPFYEKLNGVLSEHGFDDFVEELCAPYYTEGTGRPSIVPGVYFRMMFVGYFEAIQSERGLCWRIGDSLSLRTFVGLELTESVPNHSALSRIRCRYGLSVQVRVFEWVLEVLREQKLLNGRKLGVDSTTLEANAAMRSIVQKTSGKTYKAWLKELAEAEGIENPDTTDTTRMDRKRKKKVSNQEWTHPHDPDAQIARMKNGTTRVAHKVEHAVDLQTGALVAVEVYGGSAADTQTLESTLNSAENYLPEKSEEIVADAGYHSNAVLRELASNGQRSYIPEPKRKGRNWKGKTQAQNDVYRNRERIKRAKGKKLQRLRGELVERAFQHTYDRCGMKRLYLRGRENIMKRLLLHACGFNLSLILRRDLGYGTPKGFARQLIFQFIRFIQRSALAKIECLHLYGIHVGPLCRPLST
ncbi:MAG: transposase [Verrucomicrobiota bacterium]